MGEFVVLSARRLWVFLCELPRHWVGEWRSRAGEFGKVP